MHQLIIHGEGNADRLRRTLYWASGYFESVVYYTADIGNATEALREFECHFDWSVYQLFEPVSNPSMLAALEPSELIETVMFWQAEGSIASEDCYRKMKEEATRLQKPVDALPLRLNEPPPNVSYGRYWQEVHPGLVTELLKTPLVLRSSQSLLRASVPKFYLQEPQQLFDEATVVVTDQIKEKQLSPLDFKTQLIHKKED